MRPPLCFLAIALAALAGCGGERVFEPQEFVAEANARGAGLELGEPLLSTREGVDVYAVELVQEAQAARDEHGHAAGSLTAMDDAEAGAEEFRRCEGAVTLVCYRASNVVLALEGEPGSPQLAAVENAVRAMASD